MLLCDRHDSYVGLDFCDNAIRLVSQFGSSYCQRACSSFII